MPDSKIIGACRRLFWKGGKLYAELEFPDVKSSVGFIDNFDIFEVVIYNERELCDREHGCGGITCKDCDELNKCKTCYGYGLHAIGDPSPMGPMDAKDGMPTKPCPECGANYNGSD